MVNPLSNEGVPDNPASAIWWFEAVAERAHATLVNFRDNLGDRNMRRLAYWQDEATKSATIARDLRFAEIDRVAAWRRARG